MKHSRRIRFAFLVLPCFLLLILTVHALTPELYCSWTKSTVTFLSGFELVIPEEWAKVDPEFGITIDSQEQDPGFLIPWGEKDNTPVIVPIPDDTEADNDITIVPIEPKRRRAT